MTPRSRLKKGRTGSFAFAPVTAFFLLSILLLLPACRRKATFEDNYADALKFMAKGNWGMAQSRLQKATLQNPDSMEAKYQLAMASLKLSDDVSAYSILRAAEEKDRKSTVSLPIRVELAKLFMSAKQYDQARKRLVWVLERDPNNKAARGLLAAALAGLSQVDEAKQQLDQLMTADPTSVQGRVLQASISLAAHDAAAAEKVLLEGVRLTNRSTDSVLALANFYQLIGMPAKASALFQEVVTREPKNMLARKNMAWLYARSGDRASAEKAFREMATIAPNDHNAVMALANFYTSTADWQHAILELEAMVKKDPAQDTRNLLAEVYYFSGRRADALKLSDQLITENNQDVRARMLKGLLLLNQQNYELASAEFDHVLYYQSDLAQAHYFLAVANMGTGKEQVALQHMERALQLNKSMIAARLWMMDYYLKRGSRDTATNLAREAPEADQADPEFVVMRTLAVDGSLTLEQQSALQNALLNKPGLIMKYSDRGLTPLLKQYGGPLRDRLEEVVAKNPNFKPAEAVLIKILEAQGQQKQALARLEKQVAANPNSYLDLLTLARLQIRSGMLQAARGTLERANVIKGGSPDVMLGLAEVDDASGNLESARGHLQELTTKFPKVAEAWGRLGVLEDKLHHPKEARAAYEKALQLNPKDGIAANNLGWLMATSLGDLEHGLEWAKKARATDPSNAGFSDTIGWIQYRLGDFPSALEALGEAVRRAPDEAGYHYHLGMAQSRMGREKEALQNLQAALRLNPRIPEANDIRTEMVGLMRTASR